MGLCVGGGVFESDSLAPGCSMFFASWPMDVKDLSPLHAPAATVPTPPLPPQ